VWWLAQMPAGDSPRRHLGFVHISQLLPQQRWRWYHNIAAATATAAAAAVVLGDERSFT